MRELMEGLAASVVLLLPVGASLAQTVPSDRADLESAAGAGMATYAELNGYPGPKHVLELEDALRLLPEQKRAIELIFNHMKSEATAKGGQIIRKEEELESLFRVGKATEKEAERRAREIGALRGELRAVHLRAHIKTHAILTPEQIKQYHTIRHDSHRGTTR